MGSSLWIPRNFSSVRFLTSPIMAPSIKISLSLFSSLSLFHLYYLVSSSSPPLSHSPVFFSSHPPYSTHPHAPNYIRQPCQFSLSRWIYLFLLGFTLLLCFSRIMKYGSIFSALQIVTTFEWVHTMFFFWVWVTSGWFFLVPSIWMQVSIKMSLFFYCWVVL